MRKLSYKYENWIISYRDEIWVLRYKNWAQHGLRFGELRSYLDNRYNLNRNWTLESNGFNFLIVMTGGNQLSMIMIDTREKKTEYPIVSSCIQGKQWPMRKLHVLLQPSKWQEMCHYDNITPFTPLDLPKSDSQLENIWIQCKHLINGPSKTTLST